MLDGPKELLQNQRITSKEDLLVATKTALFKLTGEGMLLESVDTDEFYLSEKERSKRRDGRTQRTREAGSAKTRTIALRFIERSGVVSQAPRS